MYEGLEPPCLGPESVVSTTQPRRLLGCGGTVVSTAPLDMVWFRKGQSNELMNSVSALEVMN